MKQWLTAGVMALAISVASHAADLKVLILVGDARSPEPALLETWTSLGDHNLTYEQVVIEGGSFDGDMRDADIVWFPWNGPGHDSLYFMGGAEDAFRGWVEGGGAVWISAFDDNYTDADGNQVGAWMPIGEHPVTVQNTADSDVELTAVGNSHPVMNDPNDANLNAAILDDNFADLDDAWVILATRLDNGQPAVCYLEYGSGVYLEACVDTRDQGRTNTAAPIMENGLLWLANYVGNTTAVDSAGKLATSWGALKN